MSAIDAAPAAAPSAVSPSASEAEQLQTGERLERQHFGLLGLLAFVVMFEGYDVSVTNVVLPYVSQDFGVGPAVLGQALALVSLGAIAAALLIRLADRFGRRPILLLSAAGFAAGSLATAFVTDLWQYAAVQFFTRMLAITQISLSYLILSETLPASYRGRANGLLGSVGAFGAALPFLFLELGLSTPLGWRSVFVIGGAPLLALPLLFLFLKETPTFRRLRTESPSISPWTTQLRQLAAPGLRQRVLLLSLYWLILNFVMFGGAVFFTVYLVQERGWSAADLTFLAPVILIGTLAGNIISGFLLDHLGRRITICLYLLIMGIGLQLTYSATSHTLIAISWIVVQASVGIWAASFTLNSELFPTELRATANGVCNNLIGRWGMVAGPAVAGAMASSVGGVGQAGFLLSFAIYAAIPLVWLLPETRAIALDDEALSPSRP